MRIADLDELASLAGQKTGNFAKDMAVAAGNFVCEIYRDLPGAIIPNLPNTFIRGMWDSICVKTPAGVPAPPPPIPYTGGQCDSIAYTVRLDKYDGAGTFIGGYAYDFWGAITGVKLSAPDPSGDMQIHITSRGLAGTVRSPQPKLAPGIYGGGLAQVPKNGSIKNIRVIRRDGLADNCGNLPGGYAVVPIPDARKTRTIPYVFNDGANISIPVTFVPPSISKPFVVNVGGVEFNFNYEGVSTTDTDLALEAKLKELADLIKNVRDSLPKEREAPSDGDFDKVVSSEETAEDKDGIEGLQWVQIELTRSPSNAKKQWGRGAQDIVYAGWFQFVVDGFYLPRDPIHFGKCVYGAPDGATGYAFTLYEGYSARVTEFKRKPEAPIAP